MSISSRRKENLDKIRAIEAGKVLPKPWEGLLINWNMDENGNYVYKDYVISEDEFAAFRERMGGKHIMFASDTGCMPIGTNPEEHSSVIERMKNTVQGIAERITDLFDTEQHNTKRGKKARNKASSSFLALAQPIQEAKQPERIPGHDFAIAGFEESLRSQDPGLYWKLQEQKEFVKELNFNNRSHGI